MEMLLRGDEYNGMRKGSVGGSEQGYMWRW